MSNLEKELCEVMYDFVSKHIEEVAKYLQVRNYTWNDFGAEDSEDLLNQIKSDPETAAWALTELCTWGMGKDYCKELFTEDEGIYKINNYLFSYNALDNIITEVKNNCLWIARNKDNNLFCHSSKPELNYNSWNSPYMVIVSKEFYPEVTFENSPKKLKI